MISVIVPYCDEGAWFEDCLSSLSKQEGDFEFILVNDSADEGDEERAKKYAAEDERFVLFNNEHEKGVSGARNTGIDHAKGKYIAFLDADDIMESGAYEVIERAIKKFPKEKVIQFNHNRYYPSIDKIVMKYWNKAGIYKIDNLPLMWFGVWNKIYKADALKNVRFNESLVFGEDGLFVLEILAKNKRIAHASTHQVFVRHCFVNPNSLSHRKNKSLLLKMIKAYESFLLKQKDADVKKMVIKEIAAIWTNENTIKAFCEEENKK